MADARHDRCAFNVWSEPYIDRLPMKEMKRGDLERIVQELDEAVQRDEIRWKTAINRWAS